jgi:DNA-binding transcriptional ArsR family regulator
MVTNTELDSRVSTRLAEDQLYRALAARPRRRILYHLLDKSSASRAELARILAGWRADESEIMVTGAEHKDILLELHHSHLPQLDESELIQYNREAGVVTLQSLGADVQQLIRSSIEAESPDR